MNLNVKMSFLKFQIINETIYKIIIKYYKIIAIFLTGKQLNFCLPVPEFFSLCKSNTF